MCYTFQTVVNKSKNVIAQLKKGLKNVKRLAKEKPLAPIWEKLKKLDEAPKGKPYKIKEYKRRTRNKLREIAKGLLKNKSFNQRCKEFRNKWRSSDWRDSANRIVEKTQKDIKNISKTNHKTRNINDQHSLCLQCYRLGKIEGRAAYMTMRSFKNDLGSIRMEFKLGPEWDDPIRFYIFYGVLNAPLWRAKMIPDQSEGKIIIEIGLSTSLDDIRYYWEDAIQFCKKQLYGKERTSLRPPKNPGLNEKISYLSKNGYSNPKILDALEEEYPDLTLDALVKRRERYKYKL
ncbi:MAG: hypothetical protein NT099_03990 [Candidatus Saganbacteria bacterium]|nr:hypothetical protein [Candidatus Saganbacteria bacterium]